MMADQLPQSPLEKIKQIDPDGNEFWSARDLLDILQYANYTRFKPVLLKAQIACETSGHNPENHFYNASKIVLIGSDAKREVEDMHLSRYACYLVVQNADPSKETVAAGQTYLALQSRRQEVAAKNAGVITPQDFGIFQNHGYKGLYNGLTAEDIHKKKALKKSQHILDHMSATELAANLFRSTQAEDKLRRDNVQGKENANQVHYQAGVVVRRAIAELGGTMPEDLPTPDSIKKIERAEKKRLAPPKLKDAEQEG